MSITINFLPRKTTKERVWKALNVVVALTTVLNISGAAVWLQPPVAKAAEPATEVVATTTPSITPNPPLGQSCGLDIALVVDRSGSMDSTESGQLETALRNFSLAFNGTPTVFSLSSFSTSSTLNQAFSRTPAQMGNVGGDIDTLISGAGDGHTNWDSGLNRGNTTFDPRPAKADLVVIATDGSPNRYGYPNTVAGGIDWNAGINNAIPTANAIKADGTRIVVVGIGEDDSDPATPAQKLEKMKMISGSTVATTPATITTATDVIKVTDFSGIGAALSAYASQLCGGKILVQKQFDTNGDGVADVTGNTANALLSGFTFDVDGAPSNPAAQVTTNTGALEFSVLNGTYSLTETALPANTKLVSLQCVKGMQPIGTVNLGTKTVSGLSMATDQTISCTVVNGYTYGSLKVTKVVSGGSALPHQFGFRFVGSNGAYTFPATGQNNVVFSNVQPGTYAVEETGPNGYHQTNTTCSNVPVTAGQQASCTITNAPDVGALIVKKVLINDNGGNAVVTDFGFKVNGGSTVAFEADAQNDLTVNAGTYSVVENPAAGYTTTYSNCANLVIANGGSATCTITNDDVAPTITLNKVVTNNNGGNAGVNDFGLTVGGSAVTSGQVNVVNANIPIALNEAGLNGYTFVSITGHAKCPQVLNGTVTLNEGENISCTITNDDVAPTITLNKVVINNNGGNAGVNDFGLTVGGVAVTSGQVKAVNANTPIALNEAGLTGYTFVSITGNAKCPAVLNGTVTLNEGENITCTITNDDVAPTITLNKVVINNNGGTAGVNTFGLTVGGSAVTSGQVKVVNANTPIALNEAGLFGYSFVSITGNAKCPAVLGGTVTLNEGENITCTITNDDIAPKLTVYKTVINNDGGTASASDFTLNVNAINATPHQFAGATTGTLVTLNQGAYEVTEEFFPGYSPAFSTDCVGSIKVGETKTCYVTNTDDTPHLVVIKHVINDDGGAKIASDFTMHVNGTNVSSPSFPGTEAGTTISLNKGTYAVTESGPAGYADSYSADCTGSIALGQTKFCTITNNDIAPTLQVIKHVINNNGGNKAAADFTMSVTGTNVSDPSFAGDESGTVVSLNAGTYAVGETGPAGYAGTLSNDCAGTIALGQQKVCTVTNNDIAANISVDKTGPATVQAGNTITYTITWNVLAPGFAKNAVLTDTLPSNVTFVSANCGTTAGTCVIDSSTPGTVSWTLGDRVAADSGTVTLTVKTASPEINGTLVHNDVVFTTDDQKAADDHTTIVESDFTIEIVKTDDVDPVAAGGQITYTLNWSTTGNAPISLVTIADALPTNTSFVSASNGGTVTAGIVTWHLGSANPGDTGSVTLTVSVASPIANGTIVTNIATVCAQTFTRTQQEVIAHCDTDDETTTVQSAPNLSITKSNNIVGFTNPGKTVTYTVVVTNATNATDTAHAVVLTDVLPAGFTFADTGLGTKSFNLGELAPSASVTTTYLVNISAGQLAGVYTNTAAAQGSNTSKVGASSTVEVRVPEILGSSTSPELTITKKVNPKVTNPGKIVSYTVVVKNIGDGDAENVVVTDTLPKGFTFVDGGKATKTWKLGTLEVNHERVLNYQVRVGENVRAGKYINVAEVTADGMSAEARATVEVKVPKVLGLATTGASARDYAFFILGLSMIALGGLWIARQRRSSEALV